MVISAAIRLVCCNSSFCAILNRQQMLFDLLSTPYAVSGTTSAFFHLSSSRNLRMTEMDNKARVVHQVDIFSQGFLFAILEEQLFRFFFSKVKNQNNKTFQFHQNARSQW